MNTPVLNWRKDVGKSPVFWDLMDRTLRLYGPRPAWRELRKQDLGAVILFDGVVSFGYTPQEVSDIAAQFPGLKLAPIVPNGVNPSVTLALAIGAPHTANLITTPSLPFPDIRFTASIKTGTPEANDLVKSIIQGWNDGTLLVGTVTFSFDMRSAKAGYDVEIDFRECSNWVGTQSGINASYDSIAAVQILQRYVAANDQRLLQFSGINEAADERKWVRTRLVEVLNKGVMYSDEPYTQFDNGENLARYKLRPANTLVASSIRFYVSTQAASFQPAWKFPEQAQRQVQSDKLCEPST